MVKDKVPPNSNLSPQDLPEENVLSASELTKSLCKAIRNYALYPEGHSALKNTLNNFISKLDNFFQSYGNLRLIVQKIELIYCDKVIHNDTEDGEEIAFSLFRDGIQWIEFQEGFEQKEAANLLKIINKYKQLGDETDGDIVTALNDSHFAHLSYVAKNIFWEGEPLIDFSSTDISERIQDEKAVLSRKDVNHVEDEKGDEKEQAETPIKLQTKDILPKSIADPARDRSLWDITPDEREQLEIMVSQEENWDSASDVLEVLLVILEAQNSKEDFSSTLDYTKVELQDALLQGEFYLANNFLHKLLVLQKDNTTGEKWVPTQIDEFFEDISNQNFLTPPISTFPAIDTKNKNLIQVVRDTFLLLSPNAILSLGPLLIKTREPELQKLLMEVIGTLAHRNLEPLLYLINHSEEKLAEKLTFVLGHIQGAKPNKLLNELVHHSSPFVRREALSVLLKRDPKNINKFFPLIDDPSESIRTSFLKCLSQQRSSSSESRILIYIKQKKFLKENSQHILSCYRALGGCGSSKSIPFLRKILLGQNWNRIFGFGKILHRQGAAEALIALKTDEAQLILSDASENTNSIIQKAVSFAYERKNHG